MGGCDPHDRRSVEDRHPRADPGGDHKTAGPVLAPAPPRRPRADQWTPAEDAIIRSGKRWAIEKLGRSEHAIAMRRTKLRAPPAMPSFKRRWSAEEDRAILAAAAREGVTRKYADVVVRYGRTPDAIARRACILRRQLADHPVPGGADRV